MNKVFHGITIDSFKLRENSFMAWEYRVYTCTTYMFIYIKYHIITSLYLGSRAWDLTILLSIPHNKGGKINNTNMQNNWIFCNPH